MRQIIDPVIRFERLYIPVPWTGCWIWLGAMAGDGYGLFSVGRQGANKVWRAHRFSYELYIGPIPEKLELDHLCRVILCVNPRHLEAVTGRVNTLRSFNPAALNALKTTCKNGHPFSDENTYRIGLFRYCRICRGAASTRHKRSKQTGFCKYGHLLDGARNSCRTCNRQHPKQKETK